MTITTPNSPKIGPSTTETRGVSKVTLAMNNPVGCVIPPVVSSHNLGIEILPNPVEWGSEKAFSDIAKVNDITCSS